MKKIAVSKDSGMDSDEDEISELPSVPGHIDKKGFFHKKKPDKGVASTSSLINFHEMAFVAIAING